MNNNVGRGVKGQKYVEEWEGMTVKLERRNSSEGRKWEK